MKFSIKKTPTFLLFILLDLCGSILVMFKLPPPTHTLKKKYTELAQSHNFDQFQKAVVLTSVTSMGEKRRAQLNNSGADPCLKCSELFLN